MRKVNDVRVSKARLFVNFRQGAPGESGDLITRLKSGALMVDAV